MKWSLQCKIIFSVDLGRIVYILMNKKSKNTLEPFKCVAQIKSHIRIFYPSNYNDISFYFCFNIFIYYVMMMYIYFTILSIDFGSISICHIKWNHNRNPF